MFRNKSIIPVQYTVTSHVTRDTFTTHQNIVKKDILYKYPRFITNRTLKLPIMIIEHKLLDKQNHIVFNLISEPITTSPLVRSREASTTSTSSSLTSLLSTSRGLAVAGDSTSLVGENSVEKVRGGEETWATEILGIFEHEEEVHVSDQNATELHHSSVF